VKIFKLIVAELNDILKEALESAQADDSDENSEEEDGGDGEWEDVSGLETSNSSGGARQDTDLSKLLGDTAGKYHVTLIEYSTVQQQTRQ